MDIIKELSGLSVFTQQEEHLAKQRRLFLWGGVDDESAEYLVKRMIYLDHLSDEDIVLFINSPGGVISSGLALYDCMQGLRSDVCTVVCGQAASMGAVLLAAGAKGKRYAWQHSRVMIHQPLIRGQIIGPASDIEIQAEEMLRVKKMMTEILSRHTGQSLERIDRDTNRDKFMSATEAVDYGLVDEIRDFR